MKWGNIFVYAFLVGVVVFLFDIAWQAERCQSIAADLGTNSQLFLDHCILYSETVNGQTRVKSIEAKHIPFVSF